MSGRARRTLPRLPAGPSAALALSHLGVAAVTLGAFAALSHAALAAIAAGVAALAAGVLAAHRLTRPLAAIAAAGPRAMRRPCDPAEQQVLRRLAGRRDAAGALARLVLALLATIAGQVTERHSRTATLAHDLRNPLASLAIAAEALAGADAATRDALTETIAGDVRRLDRILADATAEARRDADLAGAATAPVALGALARGAIDSVAAAAAARNVALAVDTPQGEVVAAAVEAPLATLVGEVVADAVALCAPGGAVQVRVRPDAGRALIEVVATPAAAAPVPADRLGRGPARSVLAAHGGTGWTPACPPDAMPATALRFALVVPL